jgi:7-cyano-7-deazaguanine synthase
MPDPAKEQNSPTIEPRRAVVLLSGGLDSSTTLAIAQDQGFECYALSFSYGQRHSIELDAAREIAKRANVAKHVVVDLDLRSLGGSALTDAIDVPKDRTDEEMGEGIPITYVPARNTVFISVGVGWAEVLKADDLFLGVTSVDYSGYPDCRPEYIAKWEELAPLATQRGVDEGARLSIRTPLMYLTKAEIIRRGLELGVDYSVTSSCYDPTPGGEACGRCDTCRLRLKGFADVGIADPAPYAVRAAA